jgi:glycosyltransferase involved in cell wall biosynthesis
MTISVIIPAYNEEKYIGACLENIIKYAPENLAEILVVNNASTDATAEVAAAFKNVRVVNEPAKGLTKARQAGMLAARGELLAYLDADTRIGKQWFKILNREFETDKEMVCLSGPYDYYNLSKWKEFLVWIWNWLALGWSRAGVYAIMGGNFVAKKQALLDVGGFDVSIEFYGEDTDIARRLNKLGKVKFVNDFVVQTSPRRLESDGFFKTGFRYGLNYFSIIFLKKPATSKYKDIR